MNSNNSDPLIIGTSHYHFAQLGSTNTFLKTMLGEKWLAEGTVVSTAFQTDGRGQAGARWDGANDRNIMLSVLLYPKFVPIASQFNISKTVALGVRDFLAGLLPREQICIKWPNDILVNERKICGILIENSLQGDKIENCICGIGININELPADPKRTSLKAMTGQEYPLRKLEKTLFSYIERRYLLLRSNAAAIAGDYLKALYRFGHERSFVDTKTNVPFVGTISGIHHDGRLIIDSESGTRMFGLKELAWE